MPRTLREAAGFLLGLWLALVLLGPLGLAGASESVARAPELEARMHTSVNAERHRHHRIDLRRDPVLDAVALAHSLDMARRGYLAHETPEGLDPVDRLRGGGARGFSLAAENIGRTDRADPHREMIESWLASPVHRENLLGPAFNATGIGVARAPGGGYVYTQIFVTYPRHAPARSGRVPAKPTRGGAG